MEQPMIDILRLGKFYYPASKHYNKLPGEVNIICDRCQKNQLICCVGYNNSDLCMDCVQRVSDLHQSRSMWPDNMSATLMIQSQFTPAGRPPCPDEMFDTFMMQSQFIPQSKMLQSQFQSGKSGTVGMCTYMQQSQFQSGKSGTGVVSLTRMMPNSMKK